MPNRSGRPFDRDLHLRPLAPLARSTRLRDFVLACATLAALLAFSAPSALANSGPHGPRYTLKISAGETTFPEYEQVASTSGGVEPNGQVAVSIIRAGTTVYRNVGEHGGAWIFQTPQVGDEVVLEAPVGTTIARVAYDGLPTIDASVCSGSVNFSGANSLGEIVEGFFVAKTPFFDPYGHFIELHRTAFGEAQVKMLSGTTYGGSFLVPLALGETVGAQESLKTPLAGEATYTYVSENERPVGACPVPPPVYTPPPPPILRGSILSLFHTTIRKFLRFGARDFVTINQPGTVTQDLYLKGPGALPAFAASPPRHHGRPAAMLLARGATLAKAAGKVAVLLKLTPSGRRKLKSSSRLTAVLVTTLRSGSGARIDLARRTISLHR